MAVLVGPGRVGAPLPWAALGPRTVGNQRSTSDTRGRSTRRGYDAFARGDTETLRKLFDPGIVWHFPGRSLLAGDHRGVDAVLGFFGRTMELTAGTFRAELHDVAADDQHTVGLHLATGEREGRTLEDREVLVFHVRDGKVIEVWQHLENQYTYDEFFS